MPLKLVEVNLNELVNRERYLCGREQEDLSVYWETLEYGENKFWTEECYGFTVDKFYSYRKDKYLIFELPKKL
jgi:hypothetical protein